MASARYVWVIQTIDLDLLAAFTVRYELVNWLSGRRPGMLPLLLVTRIDTHSFPQKVLELNPQTLEPAI
jgi:hypothetical protein